MNECFVSMDVMLMDMDILMDILIFKLCLHKLSLLMIEKSTRGPKEGVEIQHSAC